MYEPSAYQKDRRRLNQIHSFVAHIEGAELITAQRLELLLRMNTISLTVNDSCFASQYLNV